MSPVLHHSRTITLSPLQTQLATLPQDTNVELEPHPPPTEPTEIGGSPYHDPPLLGIYDTNTSPLSLYSTLTDYDPGDPEITGSPPSSPTYQWLNIMPTELQSTSEFPWIVAETPAEAAHALAPGDEVDIVGYTWAHLDEITAYLRGYVVFTMTCGSIQDTGWLAVPRCWAQLTPAQDLAYRAALMKDDLQTPPKPDAGWRHVAPIYPPDDDDLLALRRPRAGSFPQTYHCSMSRAAGPS